MSRLETGCVLSVLLYERWCDETMYLCYYLMMNKPHDHAYKLLFSEPEMIIDLLQGFVHEPWVSELDFTTLEIVSGS